MVNACAYQSAFARSMPNPSAAFLAAVAASRSAAVGDAREDVCAAWKPSRVVEVVVVPFIDDVLSRRPRQKKGLIHRSLKKTLTDDMVW